MRFETIFLVGGASASAGALLVWLLVHPRFNRLAQNLRMRDWALAHVQAENADRLVLFQAVMEDGPQVVVRLDAAGQPIYVSPSCRTVFGFEPTEISRRSGLDLLRSDGDARLRVRHRDGRMLAIDAQRCPLADNRGAALILTDVTARAVAEARLAEAKTQLTQRAERDALTGLANRDCFLDALNRALADKEDIAVLLVDLDRFRLVNDRYGHDTGDRVLREVAARLTLAMVGERMVARLGDDDFAVLLHANDGDTPLAARARDMIRMLEPSVPTGATTAKIGASIGQAGLPDAIPFWFGEDQARYLIAAPFAEVEKILSEALASNIFVARLGKTGGDALVLDDKDRVAVAKLGAAHEGWFPRFMAGEEIPPSN